MAKLGDICNTCDKPISSYPIYGNTCCSCNYKIFAKKEMAEVQSKMETFYRKRLAQGADVKDIDMILTSVLEVIDKMTDQDVEAINYILKTVKERW